MDDSRQFLIADIPGFTPQISRLVTMMNYARFTTINTVNGLSMDQLDYLHDEKSNSIGSLLLHMAGVEYSYQVWTFEQRKMNEEELNHWKAALELGDLGRQEIKGKDLNYYLGQLEKVRQDTFNLMKQRDDDWLYEEKPFWSKKQANYYFMWFHVFEDEINHRGQIRWLRKRLPEA